MEKIIKQNKHFKRVIFSILLLALFPISAVAQTSSSTNFQVEETQFGSGGTAETCSGNQFCAQGSLGANAVGRQSSDNFDAEAGLLTQNEEYLEFVIEDTSVDLGELTPSTTGSGSAGFYVRGYLNGSYSVATLSPTLTSESGAEIDALSTPTIPTQGTEQFGINLVDNATPDVGANPLNIPDNTFADGMVTADYSTADQFKYGQGDTIAQSPATVGNQATGRTDYTISYIANVSGATPAGQYLMFHDLVVVATY